MDCKIDGCVRKVFAAELCHKHYEEERRAHAPPCSIDGCDGKAERVGMCNKHYRQHRLTVAPPCSVEGCGRPSFVGGLCQTHHKRVQRYGSLDADKRAHDRGARRKHPLYESWRWHSRHHTLHDDWKSFWPMVEAVGERPSEKHILRRVDDARPLGPDNWYWLQTFPSGDRALHMREHRKRNPDYWRNIHLKRSFGITLEDYNRMFEEQGGVCAICHRPERAKGQHGTARELAVDHCHETGKVRGLLCSACNGAIGSLSECDDTIDRARQYLRRHK